MSAKTEHNDDSDGPGQRDVGLPNAGLPSVNISTIDNRWVNHDLEILRTGNLADAEIICEGNATPRKAHRIILAGRSDWFKKAFNGDFEEAKQGKVRLQESPWQVDLMLYFLYTGGIDLDDETLTCGHEVMDISIELSRLGDDFQSTEMQLYGKDMLAKYLRTFLSRICSSGSIFSSSPAVDKTSFYAEADFPKRFCSAIVKAYNKDRPVKLAQDVLADFAFAARIHLFKNNEFLSFVRDGTITEFGNRVLTALMDGSVSDAFKENNAFKHWKDWRVTPKPGLPSTSQGFGLFGTAPQGGATASTTASPQVTRGFGTAPPTATSLFGAAPPAGAVASTTASPSWGSAFGTTPPPAAGRSETAPPTATPFGQGRGSNSGVGLFGGNDSTGTFTGFGSTGLTGGFGSTGTHAGVNLFGHGFVGNPPGTASLAFSPCLEAEPNTSHSQNSFQNILFQEPYKKFSAEELRMEDYFQGRRYGDGRAVRSGGFGTTSGSGGGLFGNSTTTIFGNTSNAGGGFDFGTATPE